MARRPQETTRLMREATSAVINIKKIWYCVSAAWPIHDFTNKNSNIFFLKVTKLDKEVIDIGREFQLLGPWYRIGNCLRFVRQECDR